MSFSLCHHIQTNGEMCARYTENDDEYCETHSTESDQQSDSLFYCLFPFLNLKCLY
jgi:hypothetical protein